MSSTLTGNAASVVPADPVEATVPSDGDAANAASVNVATQTELDYLAFLKRATYDGTTTIKKLAIDGVGNQANLSGDGTLTVAGGSGSATAIQGIGGASNGVGVHGQGDGTGSGVYGVGGDSDAPGVHGVGGTTNGIGGKFAGSGTGYGVEATGGSSAARGVYGVGGAGGGHGVEGKGTGSGGHGVKGSPGTGTGRGLYSTLDIEAETGDIIATAGDIKAHRIAPLGSAPTATANVTNPGADGNATATLETGSTNTAGVLAITTGTGALSSGNQAVVNFNGAPLASAPKAIFLFPAQLNSALAGSEWYVPMTGVDAPTTSGFTVARGAAFGANSTAYRVSYLCIF